ncbi:MAG: hypothetical protein ABI863_10470 [Ginsengibacter sp.]
MAFCKEELVDYLNSIGYNVVRLPRKGIYPLDIIIKQNKQFENLGTIKTIWTTATSAPEPEHNDQAAGIAKKETSLLDVSVGLSALSSIFEGLGVKVPKLNTAFSKASKIKIIFNNVFVDKVQPLLIGKYLKAQGDNTLDTDNIMVKNFMENKLPTYIISETIKSNSITIESYKDSKTEVALDVNIMNDSLSANTDTKFQKNSESSITYNGAEKDFLVFGFKCFGIRYDYEGWKVTGPGGKVFLAPDIPGVILEETALLDL